MRQEIPRPGKGYRQRGNQEREIAETYNVFATDYACSSLGSGTKKLFFWCQLIMSRNTKIMWLLAFSIVGFVILNNSIQIFYLIMPMDFWVKYDRIDLVEPAYVGEPIRFVSYRTIKRKSTLHFNNHLMCWDDDRSEYEVYLKYSSRNLAAAPSDGSVTWYFQRPVSIEKSCYLHTDVMLKLPFDIDKTQSLDSQKFNIVSKGTQ